MNSSKMSVIVAAFNCEQYVAEAIESILTQTFTDWELLIADDGSTDQTKAIIDQFDDPRIVRLHNHENLGLVRTWNKLLSHAKGELIAWQDADDSSMPTRLETMVKAFEENTDLMLCGCNYVRYHEFSGERTFSAYPTTHEEILRFIEEKKRIPFKGPTRVIRREALNEVEGFRDFFSGLGGEDHDFILRIAEKFRVGNISDALYINRYTRGSSSRRIANQNTFLRLYTQRIVFFLADQRRIDQGLDGLMDGGDTVGFQRFVDDLRVEFEKDRSLIYRRACNVKINNQDFYYALPDALRAIWFNPRVRDNYFLLIRLAKNTIATTLRTWKRKMHQRELSW